MIFLDIDTFPDKEYFEVLCKHWDSMFDIESSSRHDLKSTSTIIYILS